MSITSKALRFTAALFCFAFVLVAQQHTLTEADLGLLKSVSDPRISPDGTAVAYTRTITDYEANTTYSEVVMVNATTGQALKIFPGSQPRWSPNSKSLAYRGSSEGHA